MLTSRKRGRERVGDGYGKEGRDWRLREAEAERVPKILRISSLELFVGAAEERKRWSH